MPQQDQEITLGTGRLLGLFFGLVVVCALFFGVGFLLGRKTVPDAAAATTTASSTLSTSRGKPSPARADDKPDCSTPGACADAAKEELTFYKAVERNEPAAKLEPASPPAPRTERAARPQPGGYTVQVAAVTKQEDAEALVRALRRKNYRVLTASGAGDKLYHVQVGPFADLKDAESTRAKLIGDGYNPIVKK